MQPLRGKGRIDKSTPRVRFATLGYGMQPLRGKELIALVKGPENGDIQSRSWNSERPLICNPTKLRVRPEGTIMAGQPGRVLIVGAGPAGMALAYLLARRGVGVTVLETHLDFGRVFR